MFSGNFGGTGDVLKSLGHRGVHRGTGDVLKILTNLLFPGIFHPMPRSARIDIPHILQHVIVRGIEKRDIFTSDDDRHDFVTRFSHLLESTGTECLAWALLSNHFHLLLRVKDIPLSKFMRRLLTGYAVTFNLRHNRSGHLFQNRYKSIVCDEEDYLLELVRYIHLNPLRAGVVKTLEDLDRYPWCGHSVLLAKSKLPGQASRSLSRSMPFLPPLYHSENLPVLGKYTGVTETEGKKCVAFLKAISYHIRKRTM